MNAGVDLNTREKPCGAHQHPSAVVHAVAPLLLPLRLRLSSNYCSAVVRPETILRCLLALFVYCQVAALCCVTSVETIGTHSRPLDCFCSSIHSSATADTAEASPLSKLLVSLLRGARCPGPQPHPFPSVLLAPSVPRLPRKNHVRLSVVLPVWF